MLRDSFVAFMTGSRSGAMPSSVPECCKDESPCGLPRFFCQLLSQLHVLRQILVETIENRSYAKLLKNLQSRLKYKFWDFVLYFCFSYMLTADFLKNIFLSIENCWIEQFRNSKSAVANLACCLFCTLCPHPQPRTVLRGSTKWYSGLGLLTFVSATCRTVKNIQVICNFI